MAKYRSPPAAAYKLLDPRMNLFLRSLSLVCLGSTLWSLTQAAGVATPYRPRPRGMPRITVSGGTRSPDSCLPGSGPQLQTLFPEDDMGYTSQPYPTFHWYMPASQIDRVEFYLYQVRDSDNGSEPIYQTVFSPIATGGIATLQLSPALGIRPLDAGQPYYWVVEAYCADDFQPSAIADGYVELLPSNSELTTFLSASTGPEATAMAASQGLWFDTVRLHLEQLRENPDDPTVVSSWQTLLTSVGLDDVAAAALYVTP